MIQQQVKNRIELLILAVRVNAYVSIFVIVAASILLFSGQDVFFDLNVQFYGAMANNLRIMSFNLVVIEIAVWSICFLKNNYLPIAMLGVFHLLLIGSLDVYNELNHLDIQSGFSPVLFYSGLSHIGFGVISLYTRSDSE